MDHLGLVKTVDGFSQGVVVAVADAARRRLDASFGQALGVFDRHILAAPVAVMHEPPAMDGPPREGRPADRVAPAPGHRGRSRYAPCGWPAIPRRGGRRCR